jgi:GDP-D-mannose 3', 5'-epimerase
MSKKIFVTGCAGMIGSNVCKSLVPAGLDVIGVDNLWRGTASNMGSFANAENFTFRHADIANDMDWHRDLDNNSVIVHTADIVAGIGFVFQNEWSIFQKNVLINTQIARLVQTVQPERLIYLGTACSYPQGMQRSIETSALQEADKYPADPESGYGWSKLMGDIEFHLAAKGSRTKLMVLDLHNVYGWPCVYADKTSQVMPALIYKAITSTDKSLEIWGNGSQGRAFVHVDDVVNAVEKALVYSGSETNVMIGPNLCTQIRELVEIICSHPRIDIDTLTFDTSKPTGDIGRFANNTRAMTELGWAPSVDLTEGVHNMIDCIIDHYQRNLPN